MFIQYELCIDDSYREKSATIFPAIAKYLNENDYKSVLVSDIIVTKKNIF